MDRLSEPILTLKPRQTNEVSSEPASSQLTEKFAKEKMIFFDTRLYRTLALFDEANKHAMINTYYPFYDYGSYAMDYYETPTAIQKKLEEGPGVSETDKKALEDRKAFVEGFRKTYEKQFLGARSLVHPYALVKLAGAYGNPKVVSKNLAYDRYFSRKFYEIDGDESFSGNYSRTPTTTSIIRWGRESDRGKTPYSFQDFVFCKWWNKIENNRLITLRRYAMPVTDNIEFADYDVDSNAADNAGEFTDKDGKKFRGSNSTSPFVPLATAVTYFGEDTNNKLSDILSFSAKYNWTKLNTGQGKDPLSISASQNDGGDNTINSGNGGILGAISSGVGWIAQTMGFLGEISNGKTINLEGAPGSVPPDPYSHGPYENRILGPINVITNTVRRDRGLEFTQDGLKITFEYVARPISGINNKAIILDLLANMLVLCYSSGTWFGGMWRYRSESPAVYPFKYGDTMNALYKGKLFGQDGAINSLTQNVFADGGNALSTVLPDAIGMISNIFSGAANAIKSFFTKDQSKKEESEAAAKAKFNAAFETRTMSAIQKVVAAKALKGTTVPFIQQQRALLTGEPVGDWHLTVGNPFNPIAMIGNLVVTNLSVTFEDELGPDDFPIGFKAVVTLEHGLGRDRDAIESMFNRGYGRIYTLSDKFRSTADRETRVDENTGRVANRAEGRTLYEETRNTYYGGGTAFIAKTQHSELKNKGSIYSGDTQNIDSLKPTSATNINQTIPSYYVNPWMMGFTM